MFLMKYKKLIAWQTPPHFLADGVTQTKMIERLPSVCDRVMGVDNVEKESKFTAWATLTIKVDNYDGPSTCLSILIKWYRTL